MHRNPGGMMELFQLFVLFEDPRMTEIVPENELVTIVIPGIEFTAIADGNSSFKEIVKESLQRDSVWVKEKKGVIPDDAMECMYFHPDRWIAVFAENN